jgi:hypothetical protein
MNTTQPSSSFRALRALLTLTALLASVWFNVVGAQTVLTKHWRCVIYSRRPI